MLSSLFHSVPGMSNLRTEVALRPSISFCGEHESNQTEKGINLGITGLQNILGSPNKSWMQKLLQAAAAARWKQTSQNNEKIFLTCFSRNGLGLSM